MNNLILAFLVLANMVFAQGASASNQSLLSTLDSTNSIKMERHSGVPAGVRYVWFQSGEKFTVPRWNQNILSIVSAAPSSQTCWIYLKKAQVFDRSIPYGTSFQVKSTSNDYQGRSQALTAHITLIKLVSEDVENVGCYVDDSVYERDEKWPTFENFNHHFADYLTIESEGSRIIH